MKPPSLKSFESEKQPAYKFAVWFAENGKRKRRLFRTKTAAQDELNKRQVEFQNIGSQFASSLTDQLRRQAVEGQERLAEYDKSITDAVDFYVSHLKATSHSAPVKQLVEEYVESIRAEGKRPRTVRDSEGRLQVFSNAFGERMATEVNTRDLDKWLKGIEGTPRTRNHYRRVTHAFFNWAKGRGYCPGNPVSAIRPAKVQAGDPPVFTPADLATVLREARAFGSDVQAFVLLGTFAGLRPESEIARMDWRQIDLAKNSIDVPATTKTAARRIVEIRTPLREWLMQDHKFEAGPILNDTFDGKKETFDNRLKRLKKHLRDNHEVQWQPDIMRHSFGSYLYAETENSGKVAAQMGHMDTRMIFQHYHAVVQKSDAKAFWSLTPDAVNENVVKLEAAK